MTKLRDARYVGACTVTRNTLRVSVIVLAESEAAQAALPQPYELPDQLVEYRRGTAGPAVAIPTVGLKSFEGVAPQPIAVAPTGSRESLSRR